jgi:hypothetical protein
MTTGRRMGGGAGRRWEGGWEAEQAGEGGGRMGGESRPATGRRRGDGGAVDLEVEEEDHGRRGPTDPASWPWDSGVARRGGELASRFRRGRARETCGRGGASGGRPVVAATVVDGMRRWASSHEDGGGGARRRGGAP